MTARVTFKRLAKRWLAPALACIALAGVSGCAQPTGDFDRAEPSLMHDNVLPMVGKLRAMANREQVSWLNYADEELEMRNRIWRYIRAPHSYNWFHNFASEMQRTRITVATDHHMSHKLYHLFLKLDRFRSSRVRYARLASDTGADAALAPKVFTIICKVMIIDHQRAVAAKSLNLDDKYLEQGRIARHKENLDFIDWFTRAMRFRLEAYDYALAHLLVETPHAEARLADRQYQILLPLVERAERREFCRGDHIDMGTKGVAAVPSRFTRAGSEKEETQPDFLK